jgi:hypothetical protein
VGPSAPPHGRLLVEGLPDVKGRLAVRARQEYRVHVKVLATPEVVEFVRSNGGALFVWGDVLACSSNVGYLEASTDSPGVERAFRRYSSGDVDLLIDEALGVPDELHLELAGWPTKRIRAFWNGMNYVHAHPVPKG